MPQPAWANSEGGAGGTSPTSSSTASPSSMPQTGISVQLAGAQRQETQQQSGGSKSRQGGWGEQSSPSPVSARQKVLQAELLDQPWDAPPFEPLPVRPAERRSANSAAVRGVFTNGEILLRGRSTMMRGGAAIDTLAIASSMVC